MDVYIALMSIQDKIPRESLLLVKEKIEKDPEDKVANLGFIPLKNSIIGLILGIYLGIFGVDRFYKGDIGLGIAKLAMFVIGYITSISNEIGISIILTLFIWVIADLFHVWKGIKRDNLNKILAYIG